MVGSTAAAGVIFFGPERHAPAASHGPYIPVPMDPPGPPPHAQTAVPVAEATPEPAPTVAKVKTRKKKAKKPPTEAPPVNPYDRI
jgi:hypothetical protein